MVNYALNFKCLILFSSPSFSSSFMKVELRNIGDESYRKVSLGKRADKEQAMLDLVYTVAQSKTALEASIKQNPSMSETDSLYPNICCELQTFAHLTLSL